MHRPKEGTRTLTLMSSLRRSTTTNCSLPSGDLVTMTSSPVLSQRPSLSQTNVSALDLSLSR
jgi:hypothetical protein